MSSLRKTQKEESRDELNLRARKIINKFNNSLMDLEIIIKRWKK